MPITPMEVSASLTSSSLNGLMIASIFFIRDPPGRVHSNRRAGGARGKDAGNRAIRRRARARKGARLPRKWAGSWEVPAFRALGASYRRGGVVVTGLRSTLRDAMLAHLRVERRAPEPEQRRRGLLVPLRRLERAQDGGTLDLLERADGHFGGCDRRRHPGLGVRALERLGEILEGDLRSTSHEHRALERVLELADVAGPCVGEQPPVGLRLDAPDVPAVLGAIALQERADQDRDVLPALAQRRDVDRDGVDPEEQVLAQAALAQGRLGAPVRRRDEAEVHRDGFGGAHPAHGTLLEHAEELRLELRGHLRDLVEEKRAPVRLLEQASLVAGGARKGTAGVAEQRGLDEILGQRSAVDLHPRPAAPPAPLVERVGDELLAGPALADDQHVGVGVRDRRDRFQDALDPGRLPEDLAVGGAIGEAAPQVGVLDDEPPVVERAPHETEELIRIERLLEDMERPGPFGRLHGLAHRAVRGDHDHLERGVAPPELPREVETVAVREHQVHDRGLGLALREGGERVPRAPGRVHRVALALEREPEPVGDRLLVVDDEDRAAGGLHGATTGSRTCTRVPCPSRLWRLSSPPWSWTTERAIDMPSPVPSGLVV